MVTGCRSTGAGTLDLCGLDVVSPNRRDAVRTNETQTASGSVLLRIGERSRCCSSAPSTPFERLSGVDSETFRKRKKELQIHGEVVGPQLTRVKKDLWSSERS